MKPLFYILRKSIKNWVLRLKREPAKLIAYIVFIMFFLFAMIFGRGNMAEKSILDPLLYRAIVGVFILMFTVPDLYSSINNGATFFRSADINLVFTSPISPQKVLIYGFLKQIYSSFIAVFFVLFQGYTINRFSNIKSYGMGVIIFGLFIMLIFTSILKMLLYSVASKSQRNKVVLRNAFKFLGVFIIIVYFIELYITRSPLKAVSSLLNSSVIPYIPVYGWAREIIISSMTGISTMFFVYTGLIIACGSLCGYVVYSMKLDYYEDVLASTEIKETAIASMRTGERFVQTGKKARVRKVKYIKKGRLASAIFWRQILEYKKTGFALINVMSIIYAVIAITAGIFSPIKNLTLVLGVMIYLQLIFSFNSKWQRDLSNPYIYMIPDHAFKKVIYVTAVDNFKNIVDGSIVFVITGIFFKSNFLLIILNIIAYASIGSLFIYGGILTRRILGVGNNIMFTALIRIFILVLIIAPAIVLLGVLYSLSSSLIGMLIAYAAFITYNLLFSALILFLGKGVFENIEL
ncbi:putative ABC exporter domain-containing protein [Clostridium lacusfryxellense]|uniref:putative ABC exporter domain-containing protein n=1 Tax=Clostridium lacusfryxellense TaxID=205328 RepID=UPI001C0BEFE6|nr:putative ABC exporter domain-containing protein [Clostridium lacusfryxellense]MBU3114788.1 putative ABC exporter domain-containing protein [Clostridium lacusfryxellense]